MKGTKRGGGFTLIELLVVIAVIAILAAILFPIFARTKERSNEIVCISNLKQIATGLTMYVQDSNSRWPGLLMYGDSSFDPYRMVRYGDSSQTATGSIPSLIRPYVKSHRVFWCKSDNNRKPSTKWYAICSYEYRWVVGYCSYYRTITDSDFIRPSHQIVYHESFDSHRGRVGLYQEWGQIKGQPICNAVYADCHARVWTIQRNDWKTAWAYDAHWFVKGDNTPGYMIDIRHGWDD